MSKSMQPIRSHELNHWKEVIRSEFDAKKQVLETALFAEVKTKAKAYQSTFNKKIQVDSKLSQLIKAEKALSHFQLNKVATELKLSQQVDKLVKELKDDLESWSKIRDWEDSSYNTSKSSEDFNDYLSDVCYEETKKAYMKSEKGKPLTELEKAESEADNTLHSGGSISDVVNSLYAIFKMCKIDVRVPKKLLQIGN